MYNARISKSLCEGKENNTKKQNQKPNQNKQRLPHSQGQRAFNLLAESFQEFPISGSSSMSLKQQAARFMAANLCPQRLRHVFGGSRAHHGQHFPSCPLLIVLVYSSSTSCEIIYCLAPRSDRAIYYGLGWKGRGEGWEAGGHQHVE